MELLENVDPLFQVNVTCPNCESTFLSSRVRPSFKNSYKKDSDFCGYYKKINPEYYVVRVCPTCGFATTENFETKLTDKHRTAFLEKIGKQWTTRQYGWTRSWEDALQTYKLALVCAQIAEEKPKVVAGILHHIAWLYREKDKKEDELKFLAFALDSYIQVFETEEDVNNARLMYMIGEISRRLKRYHEAVRWFGRVINDKRIMDASMIKACREQWATTREDMLAEQMELPEEMQNNK